MKDFLNIEDLESILIELNPSVDSQGKNLIIDCPVCGQRECSISLSKGHRWGCFRLKMCGERGNIFTILNHLGKLNEYLNKNEEQVDYEYINIDLLFNSNGDSDSSNNSLNFNLIEVPTIHRPFGWERILSGDPYLDSRGFKSYQYCEVGRTIFDQKLKNNYIIFLVNENHQLKGYVARHVWDKSRIEEHNKTQQYLNKRTNQIKRYRNSDGTDFSKLLYGYDEIDKDKQLPVVLVEGIFDKLAVDSKLGLNDDRFLYTCATFKAFVSDDQIVKLLLKGVTDLILFYDPDVIKQIQRNVLKLKNFFNLKIIISDNGKDPDEMSQDELIYQIENNTYTPNQVLTNFIQPKSFKN